MWAEKLICATCSEVLNPMMSTCPGCGQVSGFKHPTVAASLDAIAGAVASVSSPDEDDFQPETEVWAKGFQTEQKPTPPPPPLIAPSSWQPTQTQKIPLSQPEEIVHLRTNEKPPRLPFFTPPRLMLMAAGLGLLFFGAIVALLLWYQQQSEQRRLEAVRAQEQAFLHSMTAPQNLSDQLLQSNPPLTDDTALISSVQAALLAYNPTAATRYKFQVQDGVVTLDGYALNEPEKLGAENVIRAIEGVKLLCSNLLVPRESDLPDLSPVMVRIDEAEARKLDAALLKNLLESQSSQTASAQNQMLNQSQPSWSITPPSDLHPVPTPDPQREADRLRREQELTRLREEEATLRRQTEERLKREAAEHALRMEDARRAEAERRTQTEQTNAESRTPNVGTVAWSGLVDGVDEIVIRGTSASVRHISGEPVSEPRASFSTAIPRAPVSVRLLSSNGRGLITIIQEPSTANGYTTIVRVDDSNKGGHKRYEFTLRWAAQ